MSLVGFLSCQLPQVWLHSIAFAWAANGVDTHDVVVHISFAEDMLAQGMALSEFEKFVSSDEWG